MTNGKCKECGFWKEFDAAADDESAWEDDYIGNCTRFPPSFVAADLKALSDYGELRHYSPLKWQQPVTTGHDQCGEFKAKTVGASIQPPMKNSAILAKSCA